MSNDHIADDRKKVRLIELETLIDNIDWDNDLQKWALRGDPEEVPTVDAVEVVRCKDCVHMKKQFNGRFCDVWCLHNGDGDEGFCNYGERRTE